MYFRWGQTIRMMKDKCDLPMGCDDWILKSFGKK
nr:hypothetical protein [Tanacetum cinerariifolium]